MDVVEEEMVDVEVVLEVVEEMVDVEVVVDVVEVVLEVVEEMVEVVEVVEEIVDFHHLLVVLQVVEVVEVVLETVVLAVEEGLTLSKGMLYFLRMDGEMRVILCLRKASQPWELPGKKPSGRDNIRALHQARPSSPTGL